MNQQDLKISLIDSLLLYLKKPSHNTSVKKIGFLNTAADILRYWSLGIVVAFLAGLFSAFFLNQVGVDDSQNVLQDFFLNYPIWFIVFVVFLMGPILEELAFRLGLKFSPLKLGITLSIILFLLLEALIGFSASAENGLSVLLDRFGIIPFLFFVLFLLLISSLAISQIIKSFRLEGRIASFYEKRFALIFYFSCIVFAIVHVFNFENYRDIWLALPFLVAPQLFLGLILAYIRMTYNLAWSISYHIIHNSFVSMPVLFFSQISEESFTQILEAESFKDLSLNQTEMFYLSGGMLSAVLIFLLFLICFAFLISDFNKARGYKLF